MSEIQRRVLCQKFRGGLDVRSSEECLMSEVLRRA